MAEADVRATSGPGEPKRRDPFGWDDLLPEASSDETDAGWGDERTTADPADLRRFLDDKPPHHL